MHLQDYVMDTGEKKLDILGMQLPMNGQMNNSELSKSISESTFYTADMELEAADEDYRPDSQHPSLPRDPVPRPVAPEGGWGWMCVLGGFVIQMMAGAAVQCFSLFFLEFQARFNSTAAATAWIYSLHMTMCMLVGPLMSYLCNKFTCRVVVMSATLVLCASFIAAAFLPTLWSIYLVFGVVGGTASGMIYLPPLIMVNEYFDLRRGKAMALTLLGRSVGALSFSPLISYLFQEFQFQGGMIIFAGIMLNMCVAGALFRPLSNPKLSPLQNNQSTIDDNHMREVASNGKGENDDQSKLLIYIDMSTKVSPSLFSTISTTLNLNLLREAGFCAYLLLSLGLGASLSITNACVASIAKESGFTPRQIALLVSLSMGGVSIISRPLAGVLMDVKSLRSARTLILGLTGVAIGLSSVAAASARSTWAVYFVWICNGCLASAFTVQEQTVLPDIVGRHRQPQALGLAGIPRALGFLIGPTLGGYLRDVTGSYDATLYLFGSLLIVFSLIYVLTFILMQRNLSMRTRIFLNEKFDKTDQHETNNA